MNTVGVKTPLRLVWCSVIGGCEGLMVGWAGESFALKHASVVGEYWVACGMH